MPLNGPPFGTVLNGGPYFHQCEVHILLTEMVLGIVLGF